ncbi:MAG: pyridoxal phosphate-dependent aminotransferase [Clostridiales bacterium]|nr:pyridoxal phosphate-dependent aminotransferase [Clostridiales bacterium]
MNISQIAKSISPSPTRRLFDLAAQYDDTIDFTLGDPDVKTPIRIREAACKAIMDGKTRYSANAGLIELRRAISKTVEKRNGVYYSPESEIIVTVGAMEALYVTLLCLLDQGDEVIILEPYWINYRQMVNMCGGVPVIVDKFIEGKGFTVDPNAIEAAVTPKTKAIMLNSPNNPSGYVYDKCFMERIADIAKKYDITVITDEVYRSLVYDDLEYSSILDFEGMKERTVLIYSFSKEFSMTGWRIGYAAAPAELVSCMTRLQENIVACAPLASQHALVDVLNDPEFDSKEIISKFASRRDCIVNAVKDIPQLKMDIPVGTFYAFIDVSKTGLDANEFAYGLLESKHVAVVPGSAYGECCKNYVRIAFTLEESKIIKGFERIKEYVESLQK